MSKYTVCLHVLPFISKCAVQVCVVLIRIRLSGTGSVYCLFYTSVTRPEAITAGNLFKQVSILSFSQLGDWFNHLENREDPCLLVSPEFLHILFPLHMGINGLINYLTGAIMYISNCRRVPKVKRISGALYGCVVGHTCTHMRKSFHNVQQLKCISHPLDASLRGWRQKIEWLRRAKGIYYWVESPLASALERKGRMAFNAIDQQ